jgi:hypothetical protein
MPEAGEVNILKEQLKDKSNWEYVEIPEKDVLDFEYPSVAINRDRFYAGKKYFVPPIIAEEIRRIIKVNDYQTRRILSPRIDKKALQDLADNSAIKKQLGSKYEVPVG